LTGCVEMIVIDAMAGCGFGSSGMPRTLLTIP
jgi:hypothetical protein